MRLRFCFLLPLMLAGIWTADSPVGEAPAKDTEILWDEWGVPHIYARTNEELFYAFGWAQMHNHADLILRLYGASRGRAAEYWGAGELPSDMLVHALGFPELAGRWLEQQPPDFRGYLDAFARGLNDYAAAHPEAVGEEVRAVLPLSAADVMAHALFVISTRFVAGGDLEQAVSWAERGSNTYAVAPSHSASGRALLVQNPHLPWWGEFTWMEAGLRSPDMHLHGATLVGLPVLGIAFNEHLGWSHTNNTIDPADTYVLTLRDNGYVLDGEVRPFEVRKKTIKVKTDAGPEDKEIDLYRSVHGPVISRKEGQALALRLPHLDRPLAALQWWNMGRAKNLAEFETALKALQIPFFNVMYADREGNIFYLFNGNVPRRPEEGWDFWNGVVPGDQSRYLWDDILRYDELPRVKNPASGWLQNANDPPWTCTFPRVLDPADYPPYLAPVGMDFRPQRAVRMLAEDPSVTFDELVAYKHSSRMELADRVLDDLLAAVDAHASDLGREAGAVLAAWDRQANAGSRGAVLFYLWARQWGPWNSANFAEPWTLAEARTTPRGLADPGRAVAILEAAAAQVKKNYGALDVPWGDVMRLRRGSFDLPSNGAGGEVGVFRVNWHDRDDDGRFRALGGDSWVGVIEFGERVHARVLLSYGNSSDPDSPHYGDQLQLFSRQELRDPLFYREDLEGHVRRTEVLRKGRFVEEK